jgi:hypothetical protein
MYFIGLVNTLPLVIMAGYVLLFEQDAWLKKSAIKAVAVVLFFSILSAFISLGGNADSLLTRLVRLFWSGFSIPLLGDILSICRTILSALQTIVLLLLGFSALKQGEFKVANVDSLIEEHTAGTAKADKPTGKDSQVICGECGTKNSGGTKFCGSCGKKL